MTKNIRWLLLIIILGYSLVIWYPTRELPYHWDSAGFVINATEELMNRNFRPWIVEYSDFAHPPLLMTMLGFLWNFWGESKLLSHALMWVFLPMIMIIGGLLAVLGEWKKPMIKEIIFIGSAITIGTVPVIISELGHIYIDLPSSALSILGVLFWVRNKYFWSGITLTLAVMTKESALLWIMVLGSVWLITNYQDIKKLGINTLKLRISALLSLLLPVITWVSWLSYNYTINGWFLYRPGRSIPDVNIVDSIIFVSKILILEQGRWSLVLVGLVTFYLISKTGELTKIKKANIPIIWLGIISIILGILAFGYVREFTPRYGIGIITMMIVLVYNLLGRVWDTQIIKSKLGLVSLCALLIGIQVAYWRPSLAQTSSWEFAPSADLSYQDMIQIGIKSANFLEQNYPNAYIYGSFPEIYQLTQPIQGYVSKSINFRECKDFKYDPNHEQIIYGHYYSPGMMKCMQIVQYYPSQTIAKFESNGKWLMLVKLTGGDAN